MIGIDGAEAEVELTSVLGLESGRLELNHDVALEARVVEQQADEELVARDLQPVLTANEGDPTPIKFCE